MVDTATSGVDTHADTQAMTRDSGGTQSIQRAAMILRALGDHHAEGRRLVDLSNALFLERPTVHRILKSLIAEQLVTQDPGSRRYYLGQGIVALGMAVSKNFNLTSVAQPILDELAERTGDTFYLNQRVGNEALCLIRTEGVCPIKIHTIGVGDRRPLGVGAGGLAILSAMAPAERESTLKEIEPSLSKFKGLNRRTLLRLVERTRELGYAYHDVFGFAGVQAVGVAVMSGPAKPIAALSVASIASRLGTRRVDELVTLMRKAARELEKQVADRPW